MTWTEIVVVCHNKSKQDDTVMNGGDKKMKYLELFET